MSFTIALLETPNFLCGVAGDFMQVQVAERNGDPGTTAIIACADPAEWQCSSTPMAALGAQEPLSRSTSSYCAAAAARIRTAYGQLECACTKCAVRRVAAVSQLEGRVVLDVIEVFADAMTLKTC